MTVNITKTLLWNAVLLNKESWKNLLFITDYNIDNNLLSINITMICEGVMAVEL